MNRRTFLKATGIASSITLSGISNSYSEQKRRTTSAIFNEESSYC